jgi:hypothetical protein
MKVIEAKNPQWANAEKTQIDLVVTFEQIGEVPFTADVSDSVEYGRSLFSRASAGEFGPVAAYPVEREAAKIRTVRDDKLESLDAVVSNPIRWASFTEEQKQSWINYRQALLDVPQQPGFPFDIVWPSQP